MDMRTNIYVMSSDRYLYNPWPGNLGGDFKMWICKLGNIFCLYILLWASEPHSPISAIWMAQVADTAGICILPDQGIVFSHDSSWAGLDTVGAINVVGTLYAVVWSLHQSTEKYLFMSLFQNGNNFLLKIFSVRQKSQMIFRSFYIS